MSCDCDSNIMSVIENEGNVQKPLIGGKIDISVISETNGDQKDKGCWKTVLNKRPRVYKVISTITTKLLVYASIYLIFEKTELETTNLLIFFSLIFTSYFAGVLFNRLGLPHVLAMLLVGAAYRNFNSFDNLDQLRPYFIVARYVTVAVVLTKSGLALDLNFVKSNKIEVIKLSIIPCTAEAIVLAIAVFFIKKFTWDWSLVLGYAVCGMSPTASFENILKMKQDKTYNNPYMTKLIGNSAVIEDIFAISMFTVILSSVGGNYLTFIFAFLYLFCGFVISSMYGTIVGFVPEKNDEYVNVKRTMLILFGSLVIYFGAKSFNVSPGGPLGVVVAAGVAMLVWKSKGLEDENHTVITINNLWSLVMEPMLFALVGVEIDFNYVYNMDLLIDIGIILIGSMARILVSSLCLINSKQTLKEKIFIILSFLSKGTVQAALGPQPFDIFYLDSRFVTLEILKYSVLALFTVTSIATISVRLYASLILAKIRKTDNV